MELARHPSLALVVVLATGAACPVWWEAVPEAQEPRCGDGEVGPDERCDDENELDHDRCAADCSEETLVVDMCAARSHTCVALADGAVRCWGSGAAGQLGSGGVGLRGDAAAELPAPDIEISGEAAQVVCNDDFTCVRLVDGAVRCWGGNDWGQLGLGDTDHRGDEPGELPVPAIALGAKASAIAAGHGHVCAIVAGDELRCWGWNLLGQLGAGHRDALGDDADELPPPAVALADVAEVVAGVSHTCARTKAGTVHCWGSGSRGELGYGDTSRRGDDPDELPTPAVALGAAAVQLAAGAHHTCALLDGGALRCWGANDAGQLGQAHLGDVGDEPGEMPPAATAVDAVVQVVAGADHTCVRHETGEVRCWGAGADGQLGDGKTADVGLDPLTFPPPPVDLGGEADLLAASAGDTTCARLTDGSLRCWGANESGQLGLGFAQAGPSGVTPGVAGRVLF